MICSAIRSGSVCGKPADGIIVTPLGEVGVCDEHYEKSDGKSMMFTINGKRVMLGPPKEVLAPDPAPAPVPPAKKSWWPW